MPPSADHATPLALTFILPTRNRRDYVTRAIDSCLQAHGPDLRVELLVVDGNSTDGSFEELQQRYGSDPRVRLVRQSGPKGFMPACFFAVPQVRTPFVTFMYDDDVLSPFWGDLPREMRRRGADFVMGFSTESDIGRIAPFQRVTRLRVVTPSFLIRAFFGCGQELSSHGLPYSPICCLTRTDRLLEWMTELQQFTRDRPLRDYFMMQRNAGPDLMIYLHSIASHTGEICLFDGPVAQFSAHVASFTSGLEPTDLTIGYWLAHVWLCDRLQRLNRNSDAGWCSAYAVKQGLRLVLKRVRRRRWAWLGSLLGEIGALAARSLAGASAGSFLKSLFVLLLPRGWRPQFGLSSRTESLLT
jgi:glycosyltransferase involved in cell wall biosynthesis